MVHTPQGISTAWRIAVSRLDGPADGKSGVTLTAKVGMRFAGLDDVEMTIFDAMAHLVNRRVAGSAKYIMQLIELVIVLAHQPARILLHQMKAQKAYDEPIDMQFAADQAVQMVAQIAPV
jgi:hypothetical protein